MPQDRIIITGNAAAVITFEVKSDGTRIPEQYQIESIIIQNEVNKIPSAKLIIIDGNASEENFTASNDDIFIPGKHIDIALGYVNSEVQKIFKGIIIKHSIKVRSNGASILVVECRAETFKMTLTRKSKFYADISDSSAIEDIFSSYSIDADIETSNITHPHLVQHDCTDWDFVLNRLDVNNRICISALDKVKIIKPSMNGSTALNLVFGASILDLDLETDARLQFNSVATSHWNVNDNEIAQESINDPEISMAGNLKTSDLSDVNGGNTYTLQNGGTFSEQEMKEWGTSFWEKKQLAKTRGKVTFKGTHQVQTGNIIELSGVGDRFNGKYFVSGMLHQISAGDWITTAQLGLNPDWFTDIYDISSKPAAGLIPHINGLQIGIVTQLQDDPEDNNRIKVNIPIIQKSDEGLWARVSTLDAGNNRGTFFLPEIGDEVIVGFINDDPRSAIVLGMLNSSYRPAPLTASDDNQIKGVVTRSGMQMLFDDDKKMFTLKTPNEKLIIIDEEQDLIEIKDNYDNVIKLDSEGISFISNKDIILEAQRDIKLTAASKIEQVAQINVKVEGSAGVELKSSGSMTIQGSIVQIN